MTLNTSNGVSSSHLRISPHDPDTATPRRRSTIGSPSAAVFRPANISLPQVSPLQHQFLPILSPGQGTTLHLGGSSGGASLQYRSKSPFRKALSPHRRRQSSNSPERRNEHSPQPGAAGWLGHGRKTAKHYPLNFQSGGPFNMQGKRSDVAPQSIAGSRPSFRTRDTSQSAHSTQSMSLPSTPNHHARQLNGASRSPSPPACLLDSPRSAASEPVSTPYSKTPTAGCLYETLLVDARRRMPYSLGIDKLKPEKPKLEQLSQAQEDLLTRDIQIEFERLKPSSESEVRRRKFLDKLALILNEQWPGYGTEVHAFGSTENHLCMNDSDVDVCITTKCKEIEMTCNLASTLAKRGMERIVCVPGAKVPIVKIWDPEFQVACDMNVNSTVALDNTRMIKTYVEIDERVRPLALIIKHWTKQRVLNNAAIGGTLSSYTWICMILNFLQTREPPILPSLHMRPHKKKPPNNGVDVSFDDDIDSLRGWGKDNKETLGQLLFAFFKKYGHDLDYEKVVISVRHGKLLSKEEKSWQFLQNNRLCVEEPFNYARNLGNTADDCSMRGIHLEFRRAHKILTEKADLAECCGQYEFPAEEPHHTLPVLPPSRPVTLSRSNSNHGRSRNGYTPSNQRGGRGFQYNRNAQNRRASHGAFAQSLLQPQYYHPEMFGYVPTAQDQLFAIQAQIQAHAHVQAQLAHVHAQAHAQAQLHGQHANLPQSTPPLSSSGTSNLHDIVNAFQHANLSQSTPPLSSSGASNLHDAVNPFQHITSWPYLAQLYGMNMLYPGFAMAQTTPSSETPTVPGSSPPHTPGMLDKRQDHRHDNARLGVGRGGRKAAVYPNGMRSQSQPPPLSPAIGYNRSIPTIGTAGSEDEDFGDHSSNGNPPETPPEEEQDEYVGYYTIGGSLQPDLAVVDPQVGEEESFLEQKTMVDRQKRFSQEKLPPPLLDQSRSPSPVLANGEGKRSSSDGSFEGDRQLDAVNGVPPFRSSKFPSTGDEIFSFENGTANSFDGTSDSLPISNSDSLGASERQRRQLFAQKLLEVHNQARASSGLPQPAGQSPIASTPASTGAASFSTAGSLSEGDSERFASPHPSPNLRQRVTSQPSVWTNSKPQGADSFKIRGYSSSQDDLSLPPLTPVLEAPSPVTATARKESDAKPSTESQKPINGTKRNNRTKDIPIPPTPTPTPTPAEKNGQRNGGGRSKVNGARSSAAGGHTNKSGRKEGAEQKNDQKPGEGKAVWKKFKTKRKRSQPNTRQETVKESEKKGG